VVILQKLTALVIRASEELTDEFKDKVRSAHPDMEVEFRDIDPRNANQAHQAANDAGEQVIVLLRQDPLIKQLMEAGVPCIPILPGPGPLQRVAGMNVVFEDYAQP
jgi:hypothetical protein